MAQYDVQMDGARDYVLRIIANQGTQNIAANTSVVNWSLVAMGTWGSWGNTATPWSVNIGGHVTSGTLPTYNPNPSQVIASGSTTVSHRADGTQTITVTGWWNSGHGNIGAGTASGPLTLTTIPRASTPTFTVGGVAATAVDAGDSVTINTNRASTDFTHTITWKFGNQTGNIGSGITTSTTWTPPLSMLTEIPSSMNGAVQIITTTFSGSTNVGSKTVNLTLRVPTEAAPDFTTVTHAEATIAPNVNGLIGAYVKDISSLAVAITGVNAKYGASPAQYKIEIAGQTINAQSGTTGVLSQSGALALKGTVTDSRGMSTTKTFTVNVLNYALPAINSASAVRSTVGGVVDANGTYIKVDIAAVVQSLVVGTQKNALTWKIKTRSNGDETPWTEIAPVAEDTITATGYSDDTILGTYTVADSFNVRIEVSDKLGKVSAMELTVATGGTLVHFSHTVDGVGVGKYHEQGSIDALGQIYQNNGKAVIDEDSLGAELTTHLTPLNNAVTALGTGFRPLQSINFTSSGTFTKASYPWLRAIRVRLVGGGGGGGGSEATSAGNFNSIGSGGGGGGYAEAFITNMASVPASVPVTVGAGGAVAVGGSGGVGGASSFGTLVAANGGNGGAVKPNNGFPPYISGASGGEGTAGDILVKGQGGTTGTSLNSLGSSGAGGSSVLGGGGASTGTGAGNSGTTGQAGGLYGGGGSGATSNGGTNARQGAPGAQGIVIVELYA